jgi:hypothetical protein
MSGAQLRQVLQMAPSKFRELLLPENCPTNARCVVVSVRCGGRERLSELWPTSIDFCASFSSAWRRSSLDCHTRNADSRSPI